MGMSKDRFCTVLKYEKELGELGISGENQLRYFSEQPERMAQRMDDIYEIKSRIAEDNLKSADREYLLGRANQELEKLNRAGSIGSREKEFLSYIRPKIRDVFGMVLGGAAAYALIKTNETSKRKRNDTLRKEIMEIIGSASEVNNDGQGEGV
jgi:hypothetical protein